MSKHMALEGDRAGAGPQKRRRQPESTSIKTFFRPRAGERIMGHEEETLRGTDFSERTFRRNATLFDDNRMSDPMRASETAAAVQRLQMTFGNRYVQRLVEHGSRRRTAAGRAGVKGAASEDKYEQEASRAADGAKAVTETTVQRGEDERARVMSRASVTGPSDVVQRDIKDMLRKLFGKKKPRPTPEELAEAEEDLAKLEQGIEEKEEEVEVEEEQVLTDEELEKALEDLDEDVSGPLEKELTEEEADEELEKVEEEILKDEVDMTSRELERAMKKADGIANGLTKKYKKLLWKLAYLSKKYGTLALKGKDKKAESVLERFLKTQAELDNTLKAADAAWVRVSELRDLKEAQIDKALAKSIVPETDAKDKLKKLDKKMGEVSKEHEKLKSTAMDELEEKPLELVVEKGSESESEEELEPIEILTEELESIEILIEEPEEEPESLEVLTDEPEKEEERTVMFA